MNILLSFDTHNYTLNLNYWGRESKIKEGESKFPPLREYCL